MSHWFKYFNAGEDLDGMCFTCPIRGSKTCKKCFELCAKESPPGKLVSNTINDPHFRKLWEEAK